MINKKCTICVLNKSLCINCLVFQTAYGFLPNMETIEKEETIGGARVL